MLVMIPRRYITPTIIALAMVGTYSLNDSLFDVGVMIACGVGAYILNKVDIHPGTLALGLIRGPIANQGFTQGMLMSQASGSWINVFVLQPVSLGLIGLIVVAVVTGIRLNRRAQLVAATPDAAAE